MAFVLLKVRYGGFWDHFTYRNGHEIDIPLSIHEINMPNVRSQIFNFCCLGTANFVLYILKEDQYGWTMKTSLTTNEQLNEIFATSSCPTVYVGSDTPSSDHGASSSYVPPFDGSQSEAFYFDPSQPIEDTSAFFLNDWHEELNQFGRAVGPTDNQYTGPFHISSAPPQYTIPDLNERIETRMIEPPPGGDDAEEAQLEEGESEGDDDFEAIPTTSSSSSGEESNLYHGGTQLNRRIFAEFTAWIHAEGGMQKLLQMMYPAEYPEVQEVDHDTDHMANWIVPIIPLRPRDSAVYQEAELNPSELGPNSTYKSKDDIMIAVGLWHLEQKKEFKVFKSDKGRMVLNCKVSSECPFRMGWVSNGGLWVNRRFRPEHTCSSYELTRRHHRTVHSIVIASLFADRMRRDAEIIKPKVIQNELRATYGLHCSYDLCLKGRNRALEMVYGTYKQSFEDLPGYLHMLEAMNPRTVTGFEMDDAGRFKQVFIALGASITAYKRGYIRPAMAIDATHLKGKNRGVMFVAVAKDANEQLFPLAYGVGPIEDLDSWVWFLQCLRRAYGPLAGHLVVSDQHVAIAPAMEAVLPDAVHAFCYYHMAKNLKGSARTVGEQFLHASYCYEAHEFNKFMGGIRQTSRLAYNRLMEIGPAKWSRHHCPANRFTHMTSNAAECFNNSILWARRLPICACLDAIRHIIEEWFIERRQKWRDDPEDITVEARRKLHVQLAWAETYKAVKIDSTPRYKVTTSKRDLMVDLRSWLCECTRWQRDCLPCAHAIAAIWYATYCLFII